MAYDLQPLQAPRLAGLSLRAFAALADPTRRAIVRRLADGEATVLELADVSKSFGPVVALRSGDGRDAVVKIQRPDIRQRMVPLGPVAVFAAVLAAVVAMCGITGALTAAGLRVESYAFSRLLRRDAGVESGRHVHRAGYRNGRPPAPARPAPGPRRAAALSHRTWFRI